MLYLLEIEATNIAKNWLEINYKFYDLIQIKIMRK